MTESTKKLEKLPLAKKEIKKYVNIEPHSILLLTVWGENFESDNFL